MFRRALQSLTLISSRVKLKVRKISRLSGKDDEHEAEHAVARKWAADLTKSTIPRNIARVSYARSSGKGGQHVNTTSSKTICTWPLSTILPHVPKVLHQELKASSYYISSSNSIQLSSQKTRSQHENEDDCYEKLYIFLKDTCKRMIRGETSKEQKMKVKQLQKVENARRLKVKKEHSAKKESRRGRGLDY